MHIPSANPCPPLEVLRISTVVDLMKRLSYQNPLEVLRISTVVDFNAWNVGGIPGPLEVLRISTVVDVLGGAFWKDLWKY